MKIIKNIAIIVLLLLCNNLIFGQISIIPQPNKIEYNNESFDLNREIKFSTKGVKKSTAKHFLNLLQESGLKFSKKSNFSLLLHLQKHKNLPKEGYQLTVNSGKITIDASSEIGLFYGIQSLLQLTYQANLNNRILAGMTIEDFPRFAYRGVHIDVSRHFYSVDFLKKQLDMMAYFKINHFHWHLTDGPGWRIEIKKYPLLTQVAAWRTHEKWKDWWATNPRKYVDIKSGEKAYGGFYTQKDAKEIVKYAAQRHITVIPEIEMPGHSEEVIAVYPELSCIGKPYKQSEFCVGNEQTFTFLENVLDEIIDIFPSKYIHIGGDEADKSHWEKCPKCRARIAKEGLKNVDELQSYLIKRVEKYLIKKGRKLLGWDEILQGGLAPEATVMSWRGEEGGIKAVKSGHDAIMTPGEFCYLDSYQSNPATQPEAIGGYLPLQKVYSYNPVPQQLTPAEAKHILGVQTNLWTEYIPTEAHAEYMLYPRMLALAEVAWTLPEKKNWNDFKRRVSIAIPYLQKHGINTFTLSKEPEFKHDLDSAAKAIVVDISTEKYGADIRYTLDGTAPNNRSALYFKPIYVKDSAIISAQLFEKKSPIGDVVTRRFDYHKAIGKQIIYNIPINKYYPAAGTQSLIDGRLGGLSHGDGRWQGFMTNGMDVTIDMDSVQNIHSVNARFMQSVGPWIYFPEKVEISISNDNKSFTTLAVIDTKIDKTAAGTLFQYFGWKGDEKARYIRYKAISNGIKGGWVFLDEIVVW